MACSSNISGFVNGSIMYNGTRYDILSLAKWVSYQSWRKSGGTNGLPVALILGQWGFEQGWDVNEARARNNLANQRALCSYRGAVDEGVNSVSPGKGTSFDNIIEGVTSYARLIIEGFMHVRYAYSDAGGGNAGLKAAIQVFEDGYYTGYTGPSTKYCSSVTYTLKSPSSKRIWATAGYNGLYDTLTRSANTCLNSLIYIQKTDPNVYGFSNLY